MARKKAITSATTKIAKRNMTDAEIKEAVKRDKEWMDRIDPDEEIEVPKGMLKDIFDDLTRKLDDEDGDDAEELAPEDSDGELDDDNELAAGDDDENECDDDADGIGGGKMVGALIGGIGGLVLGSVLGAAILGDD